jgi:transcriptional regulator with XRE-family HTH domain
MRLMARPQNPPSPFAERLIALRKARNLTQTDLAEAIGSTQRALSHYEAVADFPPAGVIVDLAKALGVTTDELMGAKPPTKIDSPTADPEARRYWRRFQSLMQLPEKDQRAVFRLLDTMMKGNGPKSRNA